MSAFGSMPSRRRTAPSRRVLQHHVGGVGGSVATTCCHMRTNGAYTTYLHCRPTCVPDVCVCASGGVEQKSQGTYDGIRLRSLPLGSGRRSAAPDFRPCRCV